MVPSPPSEGERRSNISKTLRPKIKRLCAIPISVRTNETDLRGSDIARRLFCFSLIYVSLKT
jgi:hypothetical protein